MAGGQSRRFGSDKALAVVGGRRLIDRVADALSSQCDGLIVCGREEAGYPCIPDRPGAGLGPLGGLCAALHHGLEHGYSHVLAAPCDIPDLPKDLLAQFAGQGSAVVLAQPVVGLWECGHASTLAQMLESENRAVMAFADAVAARRIVLDRPLGNINRPEDIPDAG